MNSHPDSPVARRPPARSAGVGAADPSTAPWTDSLDPRAWSPRRRRTGVALAAVITAAGIIGVLGRAGPGAPPGLRAAAPTPAAGAGAAAGSAVPAPGDPTTGRPPTGDATDPAPVPPTRGCPATSGGRTADVDGDGCPERVRLVGAAVQVGARWYSIGRPSDIPALVDIGCDGRTELISLRPPTGEIFVFRSWPRSGPLAVTPIAVRPGAEDLQVRPDGHGCDIVETIRSGTAVALTLPRTAGP